MGTKLATIGITAALAAFLGYHRLIAKKEDIRNIQVGPSHFFCRR
jgi:hypothetical protein